MVLTAMAQKTLSGTILSKTDGQPVEMATVRLFEYNGADSTLVQGAQAYDDGLFILSNIRAGKYKLIISSVGYNEHSQWVEMKDYDLDLPTIKLTEQVQHLAELSVQGRAAEMTVKGDTIEYNTAAYQVSETATVESSPEKTIRAIQNQMHTSKSNAQRLVLTESAYFTTRAQADSYDELGVELYEVNATLDKRTCDFCGSFDGKKFLVAEMEVGVNAPPFHPRCRCTTYPYDEDSDVFGVGTRAARDENGKTVTVPGDMTFEEWKKKFVCDTRAKYKDNEGVFNTYDFRRGNVDVIKPHNLMKEINSSEIGKELLEYVQENKIEVRLCYGADHELVRLGKYEDGVIYIYADETKDKVTTASTFVHEATHAKINDKNNSVKQEFECYANELIHRGIELTDEKKNAIIEHIKQSYPGLE